MLSNEKYNIIKLAYVTVDNPFAGRVICGHCGSTFGRKELSDSSNFINLTKNKLMLLVFGLTFEIWMKIGCLAFSVIIVSEIFKAIKRFLRKKLRELKKFIYQS